MQDCFACDVVYHNVCSTNFRTGKQIPSIFADDEPAKKKILSLVQAVVKTRRVSAFEELVSYLENNDRASHYPRPCSDDEEHTVPTGV